MQTISQRTKKAREALGLTKSAFAEKMMYDRNYVGAVEEGKREPGPRFIRQLEILEREIDSGLVSKGEIHAPSEEDAMPTTPQGKVQAALRKAQMTTAQLAKRMGYSAGPLQAVIEGRGRITDSMARKIVQFLPELTVEELVENGEATRIIDRSGVHGTVGATPEIETEPGKRARYVPLLSWSQAGAMHEYSDEAYTGDAVVAIDVPCRKAFAVTLRGDSMQPRFFEGDNVIVCPEWDVRNGNIVVCRTRHGDVMCKIYQVTDGGSKVVLSSYNPAHPPITLDREEIQWVYPVHTVLSRVLRD